ncbi:acyl-CoA thioesterase [Natrinema caseinilyticum]|uniref:acyl-CoA thioesterase n=1 Tax=Natrinema caseinilyticum TaxID=2961570 RepID=UPI0020C59363|nr:thioesterase family protein [Natrinema caseinilyticum]
MTDFSYETSVNVRFRDLDSMGHVNNATYATYLEQARDAYFRDVLGVSLAETDTVLVRLELEYGRAIEPNDDVTIALRVTDLGSSSIEMEYEVRANGERAATARTVQALVDFETGESRPLSTEWRRRIEQRGT